MILKNLSQNFGEKAKIKIEVKSKINPSSSFQIHLSTREEFDSWYKILLKDDYEKI